MPDDDQINQNLALWDGLRTVDRKFTKPITGKSYKGDSPNPTYVIWKLTQALGPIGQKWGFNVQWDRVRDGAPQNVMVEQVIEYGSDGKTVLTKRARWEIVREQHHELCIRFWFEDDMGRVKTFDAIGGTPMLYMSRKGTWVHDEDAAKKSLTDAYTKGASWLGACADIFLGIFDDKYAGQPEPGLAPPPADKTAAAPADSGQRTNTAPADDGWD